MREQRRDRLYSAGVIFVISTIATVHSLSNLEELDINSATVNELKEYKDFLSKQLEKISTALDHSQTQGTSQDLEGSGTPQEEDSIKIVEEEQLIPTSKAHPLPGPRRSPVSPSWPHRQSTYFLDRIGALRKSPIEIGERHSQVVANGVKTGSMDNAIGTTAKEYKDGHFDPTFNHTTDECRRLSQAELVRELKQRGTYNPDLMAWDVMGVIRFLDRTITDQYELQRQWKNRSSTEEVVERNVEALARIVRELNATCDIKAPHIRQKLANLTFSEPRRTIISPSLRRSDVRSKRELQIERFMSVLNTPNRDQPLSVDDDAFNKRQKLVGESHVVPFGCDKRGAEEAGYLRLCGACQAIRKLPEDFFPPFINEVTCDTDKACLYFYDYPHGKCRQKHMNFVVLRNIGTQKCQVWKKFNLNVRVSCECFVDEMSFFAKYV